MYKIKELLYDFDDKKHRNIYNRLNNKKISGELIHEYIKITNQMDALKKKKTNIKRGETPYKELEENNITLAKYQGVKSYLKLNSNDTIEYILLSRMRKKISQPKKM